MKDFENVKNWHKAKVLEKLNETLKRREFNSIILNTAEEICEFIINTIPENSTVGIGGSVTVRETGADVRLKNRGNTMFDHWAEGLTNEQKLETRKKALTSDFYLTGVNALTAEGQIINIDGAGNRVSAMIYGPGHVIAIAGYNKITKNLEDGIRRVKDITTPQNSKRLGLDTPCVSTGYCVDCKAPKTICRVTTIIEYKPVLTDFTVILTPLDFGF
ncbi:MAG: lactate utilization protein [Spirochaetes bacterium]|nr:lactate utilization protein [Spirochaetota bacterium]